MRVVITTKKVVGASMGRVTLINCRHGPAPSTVAASYKTLGMFCRPAKNKTVLKPTSRHAIITTTASRAVSLLESQRTAGSTKSPPMLLSRLMMPVMA